MILDLRNLYFINSRGVPRLLGTDVDESKAWDIIYKFLNDHPHFNHYYTRTWESSSNGYVGRWFDVGSHTEFFFWGVIEDEFSMECI